MSAYKKLNQQDAYISTYVSQKAWSVSGSQYREHGINNIVGLSGSKFSYQYSVDNVVGGNSQAENSSVFNRRLIYDSISHLYYKDFVDSILVTSSSYESYLQSSYEVSGSRYLYDRVAIFSLPKEMYGTNIEPLSVSILPDFINSGSAETGSFDNYVHNNYSTDLGVDSILTQDNLYIENVDFLFGSTGANCNPQNIDYIENESTYVDELELGTVLNPPPGQYLDTTKVARNCNEIVDDGEGRLHFKYSIPRVYVGNVIYTHGQIIITDEIVAMYYNHYFDAVLKWKSNLPIYTHNFHCRLKTHEFNFTLNKTALETSDGQIANLISGSSFAPYFTTVGLYNDSNELVAVGKLGSATPKSRETDMSVIVKLDMNFGYDRLQAERTTGFLPTDDQEIIDDPPPPPPCIYYFTFRNFNYRGSTGTNQLLQKPPYRKPKNDNKRKIIDNGDYLIYRKKTFETTICKKSNDTTRKYFSTPNFTLIGSSFNFKRNVKTAFCFVDVTVTRDYGVNSDASGYTYDFTQQNGSTYDETANNLARPESFFRDKISTYLLETDRPCEFTPNGIVYTCASSES